MEIRYLEEFLDLLKTLNYLETAENMDSSQSTISKHIQHLEAELGVFLFDRTARNIRSNDYSRSFAEYASRLVDVSKAANIALRQLKGNSYSKLKIGFSPSLGKCGIVELLSNFIKLHPEINVQIYESNNPRNMLYNFSCDLFFCASYENLNKNVSKVLFTTDRLIMICSKNHPFSTCHKISIEQLKKEKFVSHGHFPDLSNSTRDFITSICMEHNFIPEIVANVSMSITAAQLVGQGKGISLMYEKQLGDAHRYVVSIPVVPETSIDINAFYLKERNMPPSVSTFIDYMKTFQL